MLAPGMRRQCCLCKSTRSTHRRATVVVVQTPEPARKPWRLARTRTAPPPKRLMTSDRGADDASSPPTPTPAPPRRPYHCASCGRAFRYACNLRAHMAAHARAPVAAFSCPECRAAFPHAYQLTDHLREHALLQQQVQLQEQVARQMEEQMLLQQQLEEQFMIQQAYITQTAFGASLGLGWGAVSPAAPTPIRCVCLECGREFLQRSALRQHMREHETKSRHDKESPRRIRKWPKTSPPPPPEPSTSPTAFFRCGCGAAFDTPQALHDHRAVHVRKKPFRCSQCPADFSNPWNLARHYKEHLRHLCVLSLSDLRCHVCNENFRSDEVELRRHRALHKDVRFCKCRCGATFRSGWDWEQHVMTCTTPPAA